MPCFATETNKWLDQDAKMWSTELNYAEFGEHKMVKFMESRTCWYYSYEIWVSVPSINFSSKIKQNFHALNVNKLNPIGTH